jgi:hypothetical protein
VRPLRNAADRLRRYYDSNRGVHGSPFKTIFIVAPDAQRLSPELERDLIKMDFPLPETTELLAALNDMLQRGVLAFPPRVPDADLRDFGGEDASEAEYKRRVKEMIAGAGRGLTLENYRLGLNMFSARKEPLSARHMEDMLHLKANSINSDALQYTPHVEIELGGLRTVREWVHIRRDAVTSREVRAKYRLPAPKGAMLCGVSGGGKSQLAKLIAKEFNLALLRLDVGALFGQYVGESEQRTRVALQLAEVLAPVVLWLDEVDKAFQGIGGTGDNGVSTRVFGFFLTWLAEKRDTVFVVATANDFRVLLQQFPEFARKGRFDEIFWVDLPSRTARQGIFDIYLRPLVAGHLHLTPESLAQLRKTANVIDEPPGDGVDEVSRLSWVLSDATLSGAMTGAEIEHAINEALYARYQIARSTRSENERLTLDLLVRVLRDANGRALYARGTPDAATLTTLQTEARQRHWVMADTP